MGTLLQRLVDLVTVTPLTTLAPTSVRAPRVRMVVALVITALVATLPASAAAEPTPPPSAPAVPAADPDLTFRFIEDPDLAELGKGSYTYPFVGGDGVLIALSLCPELHAQPGCRRSILRSLDGLDWDIVGKRLPLPGPYYGITWTEAGFLFVLDDSKKKRPVVYHSEDGLAWDTWPLRDTDMFEQVVAGPDGYLGLGCDRYCERTVPFWSTDGRRWERDTGFTEKLYLTSVATSEDTLIAIGNDAGDDSAAVSFRDGQWNELDLPLPPAPDDGWLSLVDVAALPDGGFAIVGAFERPNFTTGPFLLTSPDGVSWESAPVTLDLGVERLWAEPHAIAAGPGLIALVVWLSGSGAKELGLNGAEAIAWSTDGDDWHLATLPLPPGTKNGAPRDLRVTDEGQIVVVGQTIKPDRSAIWVASRDEEVDPEASPGPSTVEHALASPSPEALLSPKQERAQLEQKLLAQAGYASCSPFRARGTYDPFEFGATAAVQCGRPAPGIRQVAVFGFPDAVSLDDYWSYRVDSFETPLKRSDQACDEDKAGRARWDYGWVMCYASSSNPKGKVRWTDERTNTYWLADANHRNLARLAVWWRSDRP